MDRGRRETDAAHSSRCGGQQARAATNKAPGTPTPTRERVRQRNYRPGVLRDSVNYAPCIGALPSISWFVYWCIAINLLIRVLVHCYQSLDSCIGVLPSSLASCIGVLPSISCFVYWCIVINLLLRALVYCHQSLDSCIGALSSIS